MFFGPFGKPFYNSFISTFCHQLSNEEQPEIQKDSKVKLIYVGDLTKIIFELIQTVHNESKKPFNRLFKIEHTSEHSVSTTLTLLKNFKRNYFRKGIIPNLDNNFEKIYLILIFAI